MVENSNSDDKIKAFIASFGGDISVAQNALASYRRQYEQKTNAISVQQPYTSGEALITVEHVSKTYKLGKQTITALNDVSLTIGEGEFVAITGASGSGKSTLLQIIGCLDKPTSGTVAIESKETAKLTDNALSELRQNMIGFVFQSFYLQPFLHLDDNIAVPAMFTAKKKQLIDDRTAELLRQVGLLDRARHFPKELSGGQIQRAAIARALMNNPRIILADEPTGNLDSTNGAAIIELFRKIRDTLGATIVVVTHDATIASQADRIITLQDGALI